MADKIEARRTDRQEVLPKHRMIADDLLARIEEGHWKPGDQLPSEEALVEETETSLGTVRRALKSLEEVGVVVRQQGIGTFVAGSRAPTRQLRHFRFLKEDGRSILPVFVNILDISIIPELGPWSRFVGECGEGYVRILRIVNVAREFSLISEIYLRADRFGDLANFDAVALDGVSIRDLMAEKFNAPTLQILQTILCGVLPPRITGLLSLPVGSYGMVWTISGFSYRSVPLSWQRIFLPPSDRPLDLGFSGFGRPVSEVL